MKRRVLSVCLFCMLLATGAFATKIFIPMDASGQANHLKAYGIAFAAMQQGITVDWFLNYRGGSFGMDDAKEMEQLCMQRGVSFTKMTNKKYAQIVKDVSGASFNGQVVKLEKAPKIAVYTPLNKEPWDDAVTMALTYAEIPFDKLYANEVLAGGLDKYDWLHLHHEDFTGQYGKFWAQFHNTDWYKKDQETMEALATKNGYKKVSQMQLAVVKKIKQFVADGGNLFAMCSATETFDIALAADGVDICDEQFDGDAIDPDAQKKLNFNNCFAFKDFNIITNPYEYQRSDIDNTVFRHVSMALDSFTLVSPPGKLDAVPVMLCQNHTHIIKGFMGQTTAFRKGVIKPDVMILADRIQTDIKPSFGLGYTGATVPLAKTTSGDAWSGNAGTNETTPSTGSYSATQNANDVRNDFYKQDYEARYIHGEYEKGSWTFLGGHDPEDYEHHIGDAPTDLSKYPNSPGYRLILNNVLFPAVKITAVPTVVIDSAVQKDAPAAVSNNAPLGNNIRMYPNPANDELIISIPDGKIDEAEILNIAGQQVFRQSFSSGQVSLSMDNLKPGIYMVKVNGEYLGKVVKQ